MNPARETTRALARATCSRAIHRSEVDPWFAKLDDAAWYVETVRVLASMRSGSTITHEVMSLHAGLKRTSSYRELLAFDCQLRNLFVYTVHDLMELVTPIPIEAWQASTSYKRWRAELVKLLDKRGHHLRPLGLLTGPLAQELETRRCQLGWTIKGWTELLGVSENSYRKYLAAGVESKLEHWLNISAKLRPAPAPMIEVPYTLTVMDVERAEALAYEAYQQTREQLADRRLLEPKLAEGERIVDLSTDVDLEESFIPSEEMDLE